MRGVIAIAPLVLLVTAAPRSVGAEELQLGWATSFEYDDNIFNTDEDSEQGQEEDVAFRTGPLLELRREQGDFTYRAEYALRWESFIDESGLDAFDHNANIRGTWRLGPRTRIEFQERFLLTRSLNRSFGFGDADAAADPLIEDDPDFETDRQRLKTNTATISLIHQLTSRLESRFSLTHALFRSNEETTTDVDTISGVGSLSYALNARNRVGFGVGATQQSFEGAGGTESDTRFFRLFGTWTHVFDPTTTLSVQAGPTLVSPDDSDSLLLEGTSQRFPSQRLSPQTLLVFDPATCPTVDDETMQPFLSARCGLAPAAIVDNPSRDDDIFDVIENEQVPVLSVAADDDEAENSLTFFADVTFVKRWESWSTRLSFRRSESSSSGQGGSTILNVFTARANWEPVRHWTVNLTGSFTTRRSATDLLQTVVGLEPVEFCEFPTGVEFLEPGSCPAGLQSVVGAEAVNLRRFETDDSFDTDTLRFTFRVNRDLGPRTRAFLTLTYINQDRDDLNATRTFENFRAMVGVRWWLDPLHL